MLHNLAISAQVTRIRWRPPANEVLFFDEDDRHESMMAVATAPIKGASAGGSGVLALWSTHRPFMPLSVVEGHKEGAVTDFVWLETPHSETSSSSAKPAASGSTSPARSVDTRLGRRVSDGDPNRSNHRAVGGVGGGAGGNSHPTEIDGAILYDNSDGDDGEKPIGIWQHVLSVGRDGRCLIQSFVRGESTDVLCNIHGTSFAFYALVVHT